MTRIDDDNARYHAAAHAMQSGVAALMPHDPASTDPKHLRVGVNTAHVSVAGLAALLIDKGVITLEEYTTAQADQMQAEVLTYEVKLTDLLGTDVTLA